MTQPLVSIIVPVKNGAATLEKCLQSIAALDYAPFELIVVNDGSTDATREILLDRAHDPRLKIISTAGEGASAARNAALAIAAGEYVAFTDADCLADRRWISELIRGFDAAGARPVAGVGGDQTSPGDDTAFGKTVNRFLKTMGFVADYVKDPSKRDICETRHNPSCNVMYRKEVFASVGTFQPGLWPGEDVDLDYRITKAGYRLLYNPAAVVGHYRPADIRRFARMMFNYGRVQAVLVRKYGFFRPLHAVPAAALAAVAAAAAAVAAGRAAAVAALAAAAAVAALAYFLAKTKNLPDAFRFLWLAAVAAAGWNAGFARGTVQR